MGEVIKGEFGSRAKAYRESLKKNDDPYGVTEKQQANIARQIKKKKKKWEKNKGKANER